MDTQLTFLGAAGNVTGSCYLVETDGSRILVDCGMYQERDLQKRNWDAFKVDPSSVDVMLLTHAHLDHCGLIPRFVSKGFGGRIFCTEATAEIASIVMRDSGHIQEEDVAYKKRRHEKEGRKSPHPYEPLYTQEDAEAVEPLMVRVPFHKTVKVAEGVEAEYFEAGHILGAASIRLTINRNGETRRILFSGDIGRSDMPILRSPESPGDAEVVLVESTYGNRIHEDKEDIPERLAEIIKETVAAGGNVVIPSFAVERAQDILYYLMDLLRTDRIPGIPMYVDSPMATRVTEVFKKHRDLYDDEYMALVRDGGTIDTMPGLQFTRSVEDSKAINGIKKSAVIIAGSGMCTGGRIKHHIKNNIERPESVLLFVGYQAVGTLGRHLIERPEEVRILGKMQKVKARIAKIGGFSGHADQRELLAWLKDLAPKPGKVFVTHGEPDAAEALAGLMRSDLDLDPVVPKFKQKVSLS